MGRKASGLRNRNRTGIGTYSRKNKSRVADFYGEWVNGKLIVPEKKKIRPYIQPAGK